MLWAVITVIVVLGVSLALGRRRPEPSALDGISDREIIRAAIALHSIRQRFDLAQTRWEMHREASLLRRELDDELSRVKLLEAINHSDD